MEREYQRVEDVIQRDLSSFPKIQRHLADQVARMDEDYQKSAELPPPAPTWVDAISLLRFSTVSMGGFGIPIRSRNDLE